MGIGIAEVTVLEGIRKQFPAGGRCAILGHCTFDASIGSKEGFRQRLNFDSVETFDINGSPDHKLDLQEQLGPEFEGRFDWVLDVGTLFCIFDVSSAWKNVLYMLKDDGKVWHQSNLVGHFGRGFYAFSPSLFKEFYSSNGFSVKNMAYQIKAKGSPARWEYFSPNAGSYLSSANMSSFNFSQSQSSYGGSVPCDTALMCFAVRQKKLPFKRPVPEHYNRTGGR
jgi:hypothetical protein